MGHLCSTPILDVTHCRVVIVACGYHGTKFALRSLQDASKVEAWCRECGLQDVSVVTDYHHMMQHSLDDYPCKDRVFDVIREAGGRCCEGDAFVFYFVGHGVQVKDESGEEADGLDEALLLVNSEGKLDSHVENEVLKDRELNQILADAVPLSIPILCIFDCCHSATMLNLENSSSALAHSDRKVVSISACLDEETAQESSRGGVCTSALLAAVRSMGLSCADEEDAIPSCQEVFDQVEQLAEKYKPRNAPAQHLVLSSWPDETAAQVFPFPLVAQPLQTGRTACELATAEH